MAYTKLPYIVIHICIKLKLLKDYHIHIYRHLKYSLKLFNNLFKTGRILCIIHFELGYKPVGPACVCSVYI